MTSSTTPSSSVADAHSTPTTTTTAGNYENYIDDYLKNNNNNNSDDDDNLSNDDDGLQTELLKLLGPVRDPLGTVIPMSMLYVILLFTGIIGNVCTCIVIARNRYMHTATNFYLFSLAISDLLLLILGLPQELFMLWQKYPYVFGEFICVVRGLSSETSTNASILTITSFTIERYVAICHPLKSHTMSQLPRAIKIILVIWAVSAFCALPVAWQFGIIFLINKSSSTSLRNISRQCGIKNVYFEYGFETAAIVFFLMPITLITVLYVLIGINLRKIAVVIAFFFCYSPFHAQRVLATTMHRNKLKSPTIHYVYVILTHISGVTYYLSATINPILYQLMSRKFRIAFKDTFGFCSPCLQNDLPEISYLNMIGGFQ
ncbi:7 transmembrane receptor (rhodopsin family)-like protein 16 [Sarcoptes scabiei]|uniref:7 transmembrane receptor (Rhodopsin family)-like protein 16 n=1 Tax=Sarcoptes scabiei TaxID=52283 RepID=A0A132ALQ7_SARSC|nr:7 transmembrane receptor (rhodopsin family)-like protein 16 [Sarcoptes scabiei]